MANWFVASFHPQCSIPELVLHSMSTRHSIPQIRTTWNPRFGTLTMLPTCNAYCASFLACARIRTPDWPNASGRVYRLFLNISGPGNGILRSFLQRSLCLRMRNPRGRKWNGGERVGMGRRNRFMLNGCCLNTYRQHPRIHSSSFYICNCITHSCLIIRWQTTSSCY